MVDLKKNLHYKAPFLFCCNVNCIFILDTSLSVIFVSSIFTITSYVLLALYCFF